MARGTDQCGGETSSINIINEYGNLTLTVLLPRGCLAGCRRPRVLQTVASVNTKSTFSSAQIKRVRLHRTLNLFSARFGNFLRHSMDFFGDVIDMATRLRYDSPVFQRIPFVRYPSRDPL